MLHLYRNKIARLAVLALFLPMYSHGQEAFQYNLPFSDAKWLHYGFSIGLHSSSFQLKYSDKFVSQQMDTVHSIMPANAFGFSLGFITDFRLAEQFTVRVLPKVSFFEFPVDYNYTDGRIDKQLIEATFVEIPILIKYKSERHKNFRVYFVGGIAPGMEVSGKKRKEQSDDRLLTQDLNLNIELGMGIDMYYPLFKFSPEIRFSKGLPNLLKQDKYGYSDGIESLRMNVVTLYLQFSD
ncbi:MAG: PorT family protein [Cyclobacteriaceae bacterium]|nr:PorT family protein [Cyclobacteriaceae bacterium]